jgi:hypothetical protein
MFFFTTGISETFPRIFKPHVTFQQVMGIWILFDAAVSFRVARFFLVQLAKTGKIYQITIKYTKWPQTIPNGHNIYQMATNYTKWPFNIPTAPLQDPPKFCQIGIFGFKICHLATLVSFRTSSSICSGSGTGRCGFTYVSRQEPNIRHRPVFGYNNMHPGILFWYFALASFFKLPPYLYPGGIRSHDQ